MFNDFIPHLEEMRRRIIVALAAFVLGSAGAYFFSHGIIEFFIAPLRRHHDVLLIFQTPYEAFWVHLRASALLGFLISLPIVFSQFWAFVSPGLYQKEKRLLIPLVLASVALFFLGSAFAYFIVIPWGLHFLLSFQTESLRPFLAIGPYFSFLITMILAFGLAFDLPVVVLGLVHLGVLRSSMLIRLRKFIFVGIFVFAAILTPPDPLSQITLAIPLLVLFEISLWLARKGEAKKRP